MKEQKHLCNSTSMKYFGCLSAPAGFKNRGRILRTEPPGKTKTKTKKTKSRKQRTKGWSQGLAGKLGELAEKRERGGRQHGHLTSARAFLEERDTFY